VQKQLNGEVTVIRCKRTFDLVTVLRKKNITAVIVNIQT